MAYYPVLIQLEGKKSIVVGGGMVAQRKIETLLAYGAIVHIVSRDLTPRLSRYLGEGRIKLIGHEFSDDHLDGAFIVIAATDDPILNRQVSEKAFARGLLINAVDQPADCNFIVPSILKRGDLSIAVSTSGKSPAFARKLREGLESQFGEEYASFLTLMGCLRKEVLSKGFSEEDNRRIFHELINSPLIDAIGKNDWNEVTNIVNTIMNTEMSLEDVIQYIKAG